jgi:aminoglycoside phosphotransferase
VEPLPHGYTNSTGRTGAVVVKRYAGPEAGLRQAREAAALRGLAGRLPVPPLVADGDGELRMSLMAGVHGQDLIDAGLADAVLAACGRMLRRIHGTDPTLAGLPRPGADGGVLVHGDYGPNNVLLDPGAGEVTAVLDWEWVHAGGAVEDLAWCEWIVRMHHPRSTGSLGRLFAAYGSEPPWPARHGAMLAMCRSMLGLCERWEPGGDGVTRWRHRLAVTRSWAR